MVACAVIPALWRLGQEDQEFKVSLGQPGYLKERGDGEEKRRVGEQKLNKIKPYFHLEYEKYKPHKMFILSCSSEIYETRFCSNVYI